MAKSILTPYAFAVGGHTIATGADGNKGLTINQNSITQSAPLFEVIGNQTVVVSKDGLLIASASIQTTGIRNPNVVTVLSLNTTGINVLTNNSTAGNIASVIRGANGQSVNLQEWQKWDGTTATPIASLSQFGVFTSGQNVINAATSTVIPLLVSANGAGTQNLFELRTSGGTALGGRNAVGQAWTGSTTPIFSSVGTVYSVQIDSATLGQINFVSATNLGIGDLVVVAAASGTSVIAAGTYVVSGVLNSGTANLSYIQIVLVGATITSVTTTASSLPASVTTPAQKNITARSAGTKGLVVRAAVSQAVNITEWQDGTGLLLGYVDKAGAFITNSANGYGIAATGASFKSLNLGQTMLLSAGSTPAANPQVVIRSVSGATGNIQEWQNSAGTVIGGKSVLGNAWIGSTAPILAPAVSSTNTPVTGTIYGVGAGGSPTATTFQLTLIAASGLAIGDLVTVTGLGFTGLDPNGAFTITGVSNTGTFYIQYSLASTPGTVTFASAVVTSQAQLSITPRSDGIRGLVIKQPSATQTMNMTEWQNSTGTAMALISNSGFIVGISGIRSANTVTLSTTAGSSAVSNAGLGHLIIKNATAVPAIPTLTDHGVIFLENTALKYRGTAAVATIVNADGTIPGPAAGTTTSAATGLGYMGLPQNATTTGAYTIVAADAGKHIYASATRTVTIDSNANLALPIGTTLTFIAGSGATMTIAITTDTMYLAGAGTTGSRTLAPFGIATAVKITSTAWMISGNGLT